MKLKALITKGKHSINIPEGTDELIEEVLMKVGIDKGVFKVSLGERITGSKFCEGLAGVKIGAFDQATNSFFIKVQANGNGGRHKCQVYFPKVYQKTAQTLYDQLAIAFGKEDAIEDDTIQTANQIETLQADSTIETDQVPVTTTQPVIISTQEAMDEATTLILIEEIHKQFGNSFVFKRNLFKVADNLKIGIPSNKTVGYLLGVKLLERDPGRSEAYSRLTLEAINMITRHQKSTAKDSRITRLYELNDEYVLFEKSVNDLKMQHDLVDIEIDNLEQQLHEQREKKQQLLSQITDIEAHIPPSTIDAHKRLLQIEALLEAPLKI